MVSTPVPVPAERPTAASRLPSLTGMRFVAAFLVFTSHCCALGYFGPAVSAFMLRYTYGSGWAGVEFFFILSGFVLTWSAREGDTRAGFWRRRFVKIYPNHLVTWAAALVLAFVAGETVTAARVVPSLFLVHTWAPNLTVIASINVPSWTLSCELLFYASFPFLLALVRRIRADRLWWWAGGITAVAMLLPVLVHFVVPSTPALPGQDMSMTQNWLLVSFPPTRALDFTLGIVMARIVRSGRWIRLPLPAAGLLILAAFAVELLLVPTVFGLTLPLVGPMALLIAAGATADAEGRPSPFRGRVMVWLGEVSFAFYLVHYLVLNYAHDALGATRSWPVPVAIGILVGLLAVTLLLSWALHNGVERPCMRRFSRPRTPAAPPVRDRVDAGRPAE
jgi:peptidoglycan/LPS O-acetylase OafA/YrhL